VGFDTETALALNFASMKRALGGVQANRAATTIPPDKKPAGKLVGIANSA
jgi:hypothetical protein